MAIITDNTITSNIGLIRLVKDLGLLIKFRLSFTVVISAVLAYLIAIKGTTTGELDLVRLAIFALGGFSITAASNILNEIFEKDFDALMTRTANRPLVTGEFSITMALLLAGIFLVGGIVLMASFNILAALLGCISLGIYAFIYTPMKRYSPSAVTIGAIPGALPTLIGIVAVQGSLTLEGMSLFLIQFCWQFPHFWAIAFLGFSDYQKAGYQFIPLDKTNSIDRNIALQAFAFVLLIIGVILGMYTMGLVTNLFVIFCLLLITALFGILSINFYRKWSRKSALQLMFYSFIYLPMALGLILIGK